MGAEGTPTLLDRWVVAREREVLTAVTDCLENADATKATRLIEDYIDELSTWYLRRSRKRTDDAFFATLHVRLLSVVQLIAPFMPFTAEYLWKVLKRADQPISVHLSSWPHAQVADEAVLTSMKQVRSLVEAGHALRSKLGIRVRQPLAAAWVAESLPEELAEILVEELNVGTLVTGERPASFTYGEQGIGLDGMVTPELQAQGDARDALRQIQDIRKRSGLQPGEMVDLQVAEDGHARLTALAAVQPALLTDSFCTLVLVPDLVSDTEITVQGESVPVICTKSA
jgi:isoleucyl-tRNA synthetase